MFYDELQEMKEFFLEVTPKEIIAGFAGAAGLYGMMIAVCKIVVFFA